MVTVQQFAEITQQVIRKGGFEEFLPTLYLTSKRELVALEGVPSEVDIEKVALAWAADAAAGEPEYLVAFKVSAKSFKIVRRCGPESQSQVFDVSYA